ncbi:hypothetical protein HPB47_028357 [Ixodes persulcatus]|uniref:Uncharacterized protein n=1 Tax=Ixodes persulcatus TaxID=34615 RepID=A0AC60PUX3_IXOPE|nr:hypothetical protein HPB47_028357 [Ixodes persulcatus]
MNMALNSKLNIEEYFSQKPYYSSTTTESLCRPDLPFTRQIVLDLLDKVQCTSLRSGHQLYTDRFHTSPQLAEVLLSWDVLLTGSVMTNRRHMPQLLNKRKKGDVAAFRRSDSYVALVWQNMCQVTVLSSAQSLDKARDKNISAWPSCDYMENTGAVDRADHYCASYAFSRKSLKWRRKLFFRVFGISNVNSVLLMQMQQATQGLKGQGHLPYRRKPIEQPVGDSQAQPEDKLDGRHTRATRMHRQGLHSMRPDHPTTEAKSLAEMSVATSALRRASCYSRRQDAGGREIFQPSHLQHERSTFVNTLASTELRACTCDQSTV